MTYSLLQSTINSLCTALHHALTNNNNNRTIRIIIIYIKSFYYFHTVKQNKKNVCIRKTIKTNSIYKQMTVELLSERTFDF